MEFKEYREKADEGWYKFRNVKSGKVPQQERDRFYQLYINWNMQETNRKLVLVTCFLAIATLILSGLTIYLQYFKAK